MTGSNEGKKAQGGMGLLSVDIGSLRDKGRLLRAGVAVAVVLAVLYGVFALYSGTSAVKRLAVAKRADLEAFSGLAGEYISKRSALDALARRAYTPPGGLSTVAMVEELAGRAGLGESVTSLKATGVEESLGYTATGLDVVIERADLNSIVNFLYLVEEGPRLFVVVELGLKTRFDDRSRLDLRLRLKHLSRKPA